MCTLFKKSKKLLLSTVIVSTALWSQMTVATEDTTVQEVDAKATVANNKADDNNGLIHGLRHRVDALEAGSSSCSVSQGEASATITCVAGGVTSTATISDGETGEPGTPGVLGNFSCPPGSFAADGDSDGVTCESGSFNFHNTRYGDYALQNTTANNNTGIGYMALQSNSSGGDNTALGALALTANTSQSNNTAVGTRALEKSVAYSNTAVGSYALQQNTTGQNNTAAGEGALGSNVVGNYNAAFGSGAMRYITGNGNTALGASALWGISSTTVSNASNNVAIGSGAGGKSTGSNNTIVGTEAFNPTSSAISSLGGSNNIVIGKGAGSNTTGSNNIVIGHPGTPGENSAIRLGSTQQTTFIAGVRGVTIGATDAVNVMIDSDGQLGTISSSARYKEDIRDMGEASSRLLQLRPVTFRYKEPYANGEKPLDYGLIAEEVAEVFPELVVYDEEGLPETVKYRLLATLLLNEVQKQHMELAVLKSQVSEVQELRAQVTELTLLVTQLAKSVELNPETLVASNGNE